MRHLVQFLRSLRFLCFASMVLWAAFGGCGGDPSKPKPPESTYLPQSSPATVIENLKQAYVSRDLEEYRKLFCPDFLFALCRRDWLNPDGSSVTWPLTTELAAATNLFQSESLSEIKLSFVQDPPVPFEGTQKVIIRRLYLTVITRREDGSSFTIRVPGGENTFYLREFPDELARDGRPVWRIVRWADDLIEAAARDAVHGPPTPRQTAGASSENWSWTQVKSLYL